MRGGLEGGLRRGLSGGLQGGERCLLLDSLELGWTWYWPFHLTCNLELRVTASVRVGAVILVNANHGLTFVRVPMVFSNSGSATLCGTEAPRI